MTGCSLFDNEEDIIVGPPSAIYPQPYSMPSVSPDGSKLLFVRTGVTEVRKGGGYTFDPDSSGLWLADADGRNMKLLLEGQYLSSPGFSPDMEWILFGAGAHIYKAPFAGDSIDTSAIVQLMGEGRNFLPAWSPNGEWVVYRRSYVSPEPPDVQGIWIMLNNGTGHQQLFSGNAGGGTWNPQKPQVAFFRGAINSEGTVLGDSLWVYHFDTEMLDRITFLTGDNRYPKYSPAGTRIVFQSQIRKPNGGTQIFVMSASGEQLSQLTDDGGVEPAWTPDKKIVYVRYDPHEFSLDNGTIWIMDEDGGNKTQLTQNHGLKLMD